MGKFRKRLPDLFKEREEWQKEESLKRLLEMKANPSAVLSEEDFFDSVETKMDEQV